MLKVGLECFVGAMFAITAFSYLRSYLNFRNRTILLFTAGVTLSVFSEIGFMLYLNVYDIYNVLGHVWKLAAFCAFLSGLLLTK